MYTKELLKERITATTKGKGYTVKEMLLNLGLNENTVNQISDKKGISSFSLAMIADYLDCSVDYLLGRTDKPNPEVAETGTHIEQNNNHSLQFVQGDNFPVMLSVPAGNELDRNQQELLRRFDMLDYEQQIEVMQMIISKSKKGNE